MNPKLLSELHSFSSERLYIKNSRREFVYLNHAAVAAAAARGFGNTRGKRDEDLFEDPHLSAALAEDSRLLDSIDGTETTEVGLEMWKDAGKEFRDLPLVQWVRIRKKVKQIGSEKFILGITEELSVADREAELQYLAGESTSDADTDYGFYTVWIPRSSPENPRTRPVIRYSPAFLRRFPGHERKRFGKVHKEDRGRVFGFVRAARRAEAQRISIDFRYRDIPAAVPIWVRGEAYRVRLRGETAVVVTHRIIKDPNVGEMLNRTLLNHIPHFIFVKDEARAIRFMNAAFLKAIGKKSLAEVLNRTDDELKLGSGPERRAFENDDEDVLSSSEETPVHHVIEPLTVEPGRTILLFTLKTAIPASVFAPGEEKAGDRQQHKSKRHILGISINLTDFWARHESMIAFQQTFDRLFRDSRSAIYLKNTDGQYVQVNSCFCALAGKSEQEILGKTAEEVWEVHNSSLVDAMREQDRSVLRGEPPRPDHRYVLLADGKTMQLRSTIKLLLNDGHGKPFRILGISSDLSEIQLFKYINPELMRSLNREDCVMKQREIAVMYCDIRGFSTLNNAHGDKIAELLQILFSEMAWLCHKHRCIFDKFLGDGGMILAGVIDSLQGELARPEMRIAALAVELRDRFDELAKNWRSAQNTAEDPDIFLGIGIHRDKCLVGVLEAPYRVEFSAYGKAVTVAARLESIAARDGAGSEILVSPETQPLLRDYCRWGVKVTREAKDKSPWSGIPLLAMNADSRFS